MAAVGCEQVGNSDEWDDWESLMRVDKVMIKLIEELYEDLRRWEAV
jgi:hypothetical protein